MTVKPKTKPRKKRSSTSPAQIIIVLLVIGVIASSALLIFEYPSVPGIQPASNQPSTPVPIFGIPQAATPAAPQPPPNLPTGSIFLNNPKASITLIRTRIRGVNLVMLEGGYLGARRSPLRQGVLDFVKQAGAVAGINGTFFKEAKLTGTDNTLIGPSICGNESSVVFSPVDEKPVLQGRPMVMINATGTAIVPYDIPTLSVQGGIQATLPGVTDAFLGGVWLVHNGVASTLRQLNAYHLRDAEDPRRRAFLGLMPDGRPVIGASDGSVPSTMLASALADAGVQEAVLLDSGFSTSLVFQQTILVTGHSTAKIPSRVIPHAVLLFGVADPTAIAQIQAMPAASSLGSDE